MNTIHICLDNSDDERIFGYQICGRKVAVNKEISCLSAFSESFDESRKGPEAIEISPIDNKQVIYKGTSWLAEKHREIICSKIESGYLIDVPEISTFFVSNDGHRIQQILNNYEAVDVSKSESEYLLLGPPLMLALSLVQFFGMHASCVELADKAVLFVGDSGFGKSTMARSLQEQEGFTRLGDDIAVLSKSSDFILHADFPQLKLSDDCQLIDQSPIKLGAIIYLNRQQENDEISFVELDSINAVQVLLNHSVAVQLFSKPIVNQHLKFMADLASTIPIHKLTYPSGLEKIPQIAKILKREFD